MKEWFAGTYKQHRWKCYDCLYPFCHKCNTRPTHAITIAWYKDGMYYCTECRFPRCSGCGKSRPAKSSRLHQRFQEYFCEECQNSSRESRTQKCTECKVVKALTEFDVSASSNFYKTCRACQHPPCSQCGKIIESIWTVKPKAKDRRPVCARKTCQKKMR